MRRMMALLVCFSVLLISCGRQQAEHCEVARHFVEQLNCYLNTPNDENHARLEPYCSSYTLHLAKDQMWAQTVAPVGRLDYSFLADSISADQMRAYVDYSSQGKAYRVVLRQTMHGWVVDMPML